MSWKLCKLETLAADVPYALVGGPFGSKLTTQDYVDNGVPVIRGSNLGKGRYIDTEKFTYVTEAKVTRDLSSNLAHPLDLVFTQRGTLGQVAIIPENSPHNRYVISQSQMKLTVDSKKADRRYLYYYFTSREAIQRILNHTSSSGVPHINLTILRNFEVPLPGLSEQKRIAAILSAYDDLIENNRRRIALLEEAARLLYREWFVYLRFPGHASVTIRDGVPAGWTMTTAADAMEILSGGTPSTKVLDYWGGDIPFFTPKDASGVYVAETEKTLTDQGLGNCSSRLYPKDTLFITARGTVGKTALTAVPMAMNQSCYALVARPPMNQHYLYFVVSESIAQFQSRAVGSVFSAIVRKTFKDIPFLIPTETLIVRFTDIVSPILNQIDVLSNQTRKLSKARDVLLPRLMNGEMEC